MKRSTALTLAITWMFAIAAPPVATAAEVKIPLLPVVGLALAAATTSPTSATIPSDPSDPAAVSFEAWLDAEGRLRLADLPWADNSEPCGNCGPCFQPGSGDAGHIAQATPHGPFGQRNGWHDTCWPGRCVDNHWSVHCIMRDLGGLMAMSADDLAGLWDAIRDGSGTDPEVLASGYGNVEWNSERRALQVFGCDGVLVAHVPVPPSYEIT